MYLGLFFDTFKVVPVHLLHWAYFKRGRRVIFLGGVQFTLSLPRVSFSPESGGRVNPRRAMEEMSTQGTIRLKK